MLIAVTSPLMKSTFFIVRCFKWLVVNDLNLFWYRILKLKNP